MVIKEAAGVLAIALVQVLWFSTTDSSEELNPHEI